LSKCTVLFAKIIDVGRLETRNVGDLASPREPANILVPTKMDPVEIFNTLNEIFSIFDNRITLYGLEKIKTIGQTYMAVGGVPIPNETHCESIAEFAIDMKEVIKHYNRKHKTAISVRIGIHT
jgi:class 3 adenylate cyclase